MAMRDQGHNVDLLQVPIGTWKSPLSGHCEDGQAGCLMLRLESIVETFINIHDCICNS